MWSNRISRHAVPHIDHARQEAAQPDSEIVPQSRLRLSSTSLWLTNFEVTSIIGGVSIWAREEEIDSRDIEVDDNRR